MRAARAEPLHFGSVRLTKEYCPKCGDIAVFRSGKCVRTGCGYELKTYHGDWNLQMTWYLERLKYQRESMAARRAKGRAAVLRGRTG